jgi:hypothetical protein
MSAPARYAVGFLMLLPLAACGEGGSASDTRAYVERLGRDTTALEVFTRAEDRIDGTLVIRSPVTQVIRYSALLNPDGSVRRLETAWTTPDANPEGPPTRYHIVEIEGDTATIGAGEILDELETERIEVPERTLPVIGRVQLSAALFEQAARLARTAGGERYDLTVLRTSSRRRTAPNAITTRTADSLAIDFFGNPMIAAVDGDGRILGITGRETTLKIEVERVDPAAIDIESMAAEYAARDARGEGFGQASPRGSVEATVEDATLTVDYGRPSKRGREILGGLVPWNQVWRTGANAATHFTSDRNLLIDGRTLPAGTYTLWTTYTPEGGELIISGLTEVWGTQYDPESDVIRIPMQSDALDESVEQFTIEVEPSERGGGVLALSWDTNRFTVPFEVVRR